ncbi:MAG: ferrochelatase [Proteobacteria bacterium]|nr:ferrochelatase [Pseudomonadota bacterium]
MANYAGTPDYAHGQRQRLGVLVCNLGTPDAPTPRAVRRYLAEFLSDPRVIETPRWLWWPILHGVILNIRPRRSAHAYAKIWQAEGSPLLSLSQSLADKLGGALAGDGDAIITALGMRYGSPSIASAIDALTAHGARRIVVLPLYPQYAAPTTASVMDAVFAHCARLRWVPELRFINDYHANPRYIAALADSVREYWAAHGRPERLLLSFHGLPQKYFLAGDPYFCQCQATARLLREALALDAENCMVSFQSRVGPTRWLEPYTDLTLDSLGKAGTRRVDVLCPGFAVDCLETLEEIALQNADRFRAAGGGELRYIPALNDSPRHVELLASLVGDHLGGWREAVADEPAARAAAAARARAAGARH